MKSYILNFTLNTTFDVDTNPFTLTLEPGFSKFGIQLLNGSVQFIAAQNAEICRIISNPHALNSKFYETPTLSNNDLFYLPLVGTAHKYATNVPSAIMWFSTNVIILEIVDEKLPVVPIANIEGLLSIKVYLIP